MGGKTMSTSPESIKIKKVINPESIKIRIHSLDKVIREISADEVSATRDAIRNTSKKIVILNPRSKEVVRKTTVLIFHRTYKYYLVSTQDNALGQIEYEINDISSPVHITIIISYDVRCELGKEEILVKALYSDNSATDSLNLMIKRFVQVFITDLRKSGITPEKEFSSYKDKLTGDLKRYLSNQVGMQADIVLSIKGEEFLKDITVSFEPFDVRVMDYNDALTLQVEAGLDIDNSNRNAAIPYISQQDSLKDFVIQQIKKYLLENITLHQFVFELNKTVRNDLMEMLERDLKSKGRKPSWLQLKSKINFEIPKPNIDMHYSVLCDISDYTPKIEVEHKLLLQLYDLGLFKTNTLSMGLEEWVEEKLNAITKSELITQRYVDILLDFDQEDPEKQETLRNIKEQMQRQTNAIGYTVKHLIVQPNMKPLTIKKNGFMLDIKEEVFSTLINRVNVKLDIVVTGKISDLTKLHDYIAPDKDIEKEMERMVLLETKKQMHAVDPQEFYMPFKDSKGETAENRLKNAIMRVMTEKFHAHEIKVIIKRLETELIKRILDLVNGSPYHIEVEILPLRGGGTQEPIKFEIEFLIQAVSKWNIFIYKNFDSKTGEEIKKIKDALQKDIKAKFMTVPYEVLKYSSIEERNRILKIARVSNDKISAIFGLEINISNLIRYATMMESERLKLLKRKMEIQTKKEVTIFENEAETQIKSHEILQSTILKYKTPDMAEMAELAETKDLEYAEKEIAKIKDENLITGVEEASLSQLAPPGKTDEWSPEDYLDEFTGDKPEAIDEGKKKPLKDKSDS
jgi:hypothetical protein